MRYKIYWLHEAIEELKQIRHHIEGNESSPEAAIALVTRIYKAADSLAAMPERFPKDVGRPKFRRMVVVSSYSIFYQINGNIVYIAHIWNNARDKNQLR